MSPPRLAGCGEAVGRRDLRSLRRALLQFRQGTGERDLRQIRALALARTRNTDEAQRHLLKLRDEGYEDEETVGMLAKSSPEGTLGNLTEAEESLVARLLLEMPDPELDATAELSANLEQWSRLVQQKQAEIDRQDLDEAYRSGGDWQSRLSQDRLPDSEEAGPTSTSNKPAGDA